MIPERSVSPETLHNLVCMADEIEELEAAASADQPLAVPPLRLPRDAGVAAHAHRPAVRFTTARRWLVGLTAAAAALLLLVRQGGEVEPQASVAPLVVQSPTGKAQTSSPRFQFRSVAREGCFVLAVFRMWNGECQCLAWKVYRWDDGDPLAELDAGQTLDLRLDAADLPPIEQLLVLAVAPRPDGLPDTGEEADALLACLNQRTPTPAEDDRIERYASAVRECLPSGVTVLPHPFEIK